MAFPILDVAVNAAKPTCVDMVSKLFSLADIKNIVYVMINEFLNPRLMRNILLIEYIIRSLILSLNCENAHSV